MEYVDLNNGVRMPLLGYGTFQIDPAKTEECVRRAISAGYRLLIRRRGTLKGKIVAYEDAAGKSSIQCGKCHTFLLVDYDKMTAEPTLQEREVYKMVVNV